MSGAKVHVLGHSHILRIVKMPNGYKNTLFYCGAFSHVDQVNKVYRNDDHGRVYRTYKFDDSLDRGYILVVLGCSHIGERVKMLNSLNIFYSTAGHITNFFVMRT